MFLMGPTGCGRSEVVRVLARAIAIGTAAPTNPYLRTNNKKKVGPVVSVGFLRGIDLVVCSMALNGATLPRPPLGPVTAVAGGNPRPQPQVHHDGGDVWRRQPGELLAGQP